MYQSAFKIKKNHKRSTLRCLITFTFQVTLVAVCNIWIIVIFLFLFILFFFHYLYLSFTPFHAMSEATSLFIHCCAALHFFSVTSCLESRTWFVTDSWLFIKMTNLFSLEATYSIKAMHNICSNRIIFIALILCFIEASLVLFYCIYSQTKKDNNIHFSISWPKVKIIPSASYFENEEFLSTVVSYFVSVIAATW